MIDKLGYDTYAGVIGDLVDKVNELVETVNKLETHFHNSHDTRDLTGYPRFPKKMPLDSDPEL